METIQDRLRRDAAALQGEMDALHEELKTHQDPQKMQLIQEMIAVSGRSSTVLQALTLYVLGHRIS